MSLNKSDSDDESLPEFKDILKSFYESKASNKLTYAGTVMIIFKLIIDVVKGTMKSKDFISEAMRPMSKNDDIKIVDLPSDEFISQHHRLIPFLYYTHC
jgi:hypothetical protein